MERDGVLQRLDGVLSGSLHVDQLLKTHVHHSKEQGGYVGDVGVVHGSLVAKPYPYKLSQTS